MVNYTERNYALLGSIAIQFGIPEDAWKPFILTRDQDEDQVKKFARESGKACYRVRGSETKENMLTIVSFDGSSLHCCHVSINGLLPNVTLGVEGMHTWLNVLSAESLSNYIPAPKYYRKYARPD